MSWPDLWRAMALVLVIEGIMPFLSPAVWRSAMREMTGMADRALRLMGLLSMAAGLLLLYLFRL